MLRSDQSFTVLSALPDASSFPSGERGGTDVFGLSFQLFELFPFRHVPKPYTAVTIAADRLRR
jgi:hypothetical protein